MQTHLNEHMMKQNIFQCSHRTFWLSHHWLCSVFSCLSNSLSFSWKWENCSRPKMWKSPSMQTREKSSRSLCSLSLDEHFSFFRSREMKISCSKKLSEHFLCVGGCWCEENRVRKSISLFSLCEREISQWTCRRKTRFALLNCAVIN